MMVDVSIIIPVFNGEKYLKQCIDSILEQSHTNFEVLLIDDASTDKSLNIMRTYLTNNSRIRLIELVKNVGAGKARNLALDEAKGNYILFLDCDDWLEKDAIVLLIDLVSKTKSEVILFGHKNHLLEFAKQPQTYSTHFPTYKNEDLDFFRHAILTTKGLRPMPWGYLFSKQFLDEYYIRFSEGVYFEDVMFTTKALYFTPSINVLKTSLYNYRLHDESVTNTFSKKKIDDCFTAHLEIKDFLKEKQVYDKYKKEFTVRFLTCCFSLCYTKFLCMSSKFRDKELKQFMEKARKSQLLHSSNLLLIKDVIQELGEEERAEREFFEKNFNFLSTLKYRYKYLSFYYGLKRFFIYNLKFSLK